MRTTPSSADSWSAALDAEASGAPHALPDAIDVFVKARVQELAQNLEAQRPGASALLHAAFLRSSAGGALRRDFTRTLPAELNAMILDLLDNTSLRRLSQCSRTARTVVATLLSPMHVPWLSERIVEKRMRTDLGNAPQGGALLPCPAHSHLRTHAHPGAVTVYTLTDDALSPSHGWSAAALGGTPTGSVSWAPDGRAVAAVCIGDTGPFVALLDAQKPRTPVAKIVLPTAFSNVLSTAWSTRPADMLAVAGSDATLVYDITRPEAPVASLPCRVTRTVLPEPAKWSPAHPYLALYCSRGGLQIWDLERPDAPQPVTIPARPMARAQFGYDLYYAMAWHPSRPLLAIGDADDLHLIRLGTHAYLDAAKPRDMLPSNSCVVRDRIGLAFEPGGRAALLAIAYDGRVALCAPTRSGLTPLRRIKPCADSMADWMTWTDKGHLEYGSRGKYAWALGRYAPGTALK